MGRRTRGRAAVLTPRQWKALSSPHRVQVVAALQGIGRGTAAELAALTGRTPQSLYYHLGALSRLGLIGTKLERRGSRSVRVFEFDPELNQRTVDPRTGAGVERLGELAAAMMRDASARARRWSAVHRDRPISVGESSDAIMVTEITWLTERDRIAANRLLRDLIDLVRRARLRRRGDRHCFALFHFRDYTIAEARRGGIPSDVRRAVELRRADRGHRVSGAGAAGGVIPEIR